MLLMRFNANLRKDVNELIIIVAVCGVLLTMGIGQFIHEGGAWDD